MQWIWATAEISHPSTTAENTLVPLCELIFFLWLPRGQDYLLLTYFALDMLLVALPNHAHVPCYPDLGWIKLFSQ